MDDTKVEPRRSLFERVNLLYREKRTKAIFAGFLLGLLAMLPFIAGALPFLYLPAIPLADLRSLPSSALFSILRLILALGLSFVFSLSYGSLAAKNRALEKILIPIIDILQSVPVLGFFPAAIYFFVKLGGGSRIGVEMACVFLIFTSQAWNMTFGVYESIKGIPKEVEEASKLFGIRGWAYFQKVIFPACVVKLVYNAMLSWAAGWYFLIACEIVAIGPVSFTLPGLGSFISKATEQGRIDLLIPGIFVLVMLVVLMDIACFRPLVVISEIYKFEGQGSTDEPEESVVLEFFKRLRHGFEDASSRWKGVTRKRHSVFLRYKSLKRGLSTLKRRVGWFLGFIPFERLRVFKFWAYLRHGLEMALIAILGLGFSLGLGYGLYRWILLLSASPWPKEVFSLPIGLILSFLRLILAFLLCLTWSLPLVFWASRSKRFLRVSVRACQILAAVPATAFFPLFVALAVKTGVGMELASILLLMTGMQWYLLFNLLAGVRSIPQDLKEVASIYGIRGIDWFKMLLLPCLYPSFVTGAITAFGGGWNALIISEYVVYDQKTYALKGIGASLDRGIYELGDPVIISLSLAVMVSFIIIMNRLFWAPLSEKVASRYRLEGG